MQDICAILCCTQSNGPLTAACWSLSYTFSKLNSAADSHSQWITDNDTFSHTGVDGSTPSERIADAGYDFERSWRVTENIAAVSVSGDDSYFDEVEQLHINLLNSPGHLANILDPNVTSLGIGLAFGDLTYTNGVFNSVIATQNFARTLGVEDFDIFGSDGRDSLSGGTGDDYLDGESGADTLRGLEGNDTIRGDGGADLISGSSGNDNIRGGSGNDRIFGGDDDDRLSGGSGDDLLVGAQGDDNITGGTSNDTLFGNDGNDRLDGEAGADSISGGAGDDRIFGGSGDDSLRGSSGEDRLFGLNGHDLLSGNTGNDSLFGGSGNDVLSGDRARDVLTGGSGADVFVFDSVTDSVHSARRDTITDFTAGTDKIDLSDLGNNLDFVTSYSGSAGEVRYNENIGRLYVDLDGDGRSDLSIDLDGNPPLTESDLIL